MPVNITPQFRNTAIRLYMDLSGIFPKTPDDSLFACIGNAGHECGGFKLMEEGNPTVKGSLGGISFFQWTGPRRRQFMLYCRREKLHPYSYDAAVQFLCWELLNTEKAFPKVNKTVQVKVDGTLYKGLAAKTIAFERAFERAGIKHYPTRIAYAEAAREAVNEWMAAGKPEPGKYRMPHARFSKDFDAEFGSGESSTTEREFPFAGQAKPAARPPAPPPVSAEHEPEAVEGVDVSHLMPGVTVRAGVWPEDALTKPEIEAVQNRLRELGYVMVGRVDGKWGVSTVAAITALQTANGINPDGHYGPQTRAALMVTAPPRVVASDRARATAEALREVKEPTVTAANQVAQVSKWGGILAGAAAAFDGITDYLGDAWTTVASFKGDVAEIPVWVWFVAAVVVAWFFWHRAKRIETVRVLEERTGANTALATPLPANKLLPPPPPSISDDLARLNDEKP